MYNQWLTVGTTAPGAIAPATGDEDTGEWTEGQVTTGLVYDGPADVQDAGESVVYGQESTKDTSDAIVFLEDEAKLDAIEVGMMAVVTWNRGSATERTSDAEVATKRRLDGSIGLRWL